MTCLAKDREALLAFYDFPAEHWLHIRTVQPDQSNFATVRLRSNRDSRETTLAMVFKLPQSAEQHWRRITDFAKLELVINNVRF